MCLASSVSVRASAPRVPKGISQQCQKTSGQGTSARTRGNRRAIHPIRAFGFPDRGPVGNCAGGLVGASLSYGWVRLDTKSPYVIQPGFSGGGLWCPDYGAVVGLVGQAHANGDGRAVALHQVDADLPGLKLGAHEVGVRSGKRKRNGQNNIQPGQRRQPPALGAVQRPHALAGGVGQCAAVVRYLCVPGGPGVSRRKQRQRRRQPADSASQLTWLPGASFLNRG